MTELQAFDMNQPLGFQLPDKSLYQMGFNPTASQPPVASYVHETNPLTNPLQILDLLNPHQPSGSTDKKQELLSGLLSPHFEKQLEIERKIDDLSDVVNQFIKTQQDFNKILLEKVLKSQEPHSSPITVIEDNPMDEQEAPHIEEVENIIEEETEPIQQTINNPLPIYPVPISHDVSTHSPIRNRSISPEKMETGGAGMSVRDFLKTTMTVQKADDKILEEELERERDEAAQSIRYNKFRVRNRPKKYKRSAVTFTTKTRDLASQATVEPSEPQVASSSAGNSQETNQMIEQLEQTQNTVEIEENIFQPILIPCVQRPPELLMQPVFPTTSSYVLNSALDPSNHATQNSLAALTDSKFQPDPTNLWKTNNTTQLLVDAPLLSEELRFSEHSHHSSFLPFVHEPAHRSAFVPTVPQQYNKDRRIHQHMDTSLTDSLRNL